MFADETLTVSVGKYGPVDGTGRAAMALAARSRRHSQDGALAANRGELRNRGFYACGRDMAAIAAMDAGRSLILDRRVSSEVERLYDVECKMDDR